MEYYFEMYVFSDIRVQPGKHRFGKIFSLVDTTIVTDKLLPRHFLPVLDIGVVKIRVEHNGRKGQYEYGIGILEDTLSTLLFVVFLRKGIHESVNLLGFSRQSELLKKDSKCRSKASGDRFKAIRPA